MNAGQLGVDFLLLSIPVTGVRYALRKQRMITKEFKVG